MITIKNTDNTCKCCTPEIDIDVDNHSTGANIDVDTEVVPVKIDTFDKKNYNDLINKPKINGEVLKGDKTGDELGLVDKTTEPNRVYGTDSEGYPTTIPYSEDADSEYIVRRNENGEVIVPVNPLSEAGATSKKYVDDSIDVALEEATVFKGVIDNQTLLPAEGNRNGDMYWIREFVEPVPSGMIAGHSGTAIYNGTLQEFQFESDEIYDPDLKSIIFDSENKLAVQLSSAEDNIIEFTNNGLYASTSDIEQALQDEIDRATAAEATLQTNIDAEATTRSTADTTLQGNIDTVSTNLSNEITRATGEEESLWDALDAEENMRIVQDRALNTKIENEITRATNAESSLSDRINSEQSSRISEDDSLRTSISNEVTRAQGVEDTLGADIISERNMRIAQDNALYGEIISETSRAQGVEGTLSNLTTNAKTNLVSAINEVDSHADTNTTNISNIQALIPNEATAQNQLADKDFVNSSIATQTGNFIGTFNSIAERDAYSGTVTNNDYCFVINRTVTDNGSDWATFNDLNAYDKSLLTNFDYAWVIHGSKFDLYRFNVTQQQWELRVENTDKESITLNTAYNRYKATVSNSVLTWEYEYTLNNSSFTASQWASINSGATSAKITQITTNQNAIGTLSSLSTTTKDNLVAAINEVNSDLSNYVPYSGATGAVNLNAQNLSNVSKLAVNNSSIDANEVLLVNGQTKFIAGTNSVFVAKSSNQTRKGMYGVPMGLEIQWHSDSLPYAYPLGFHDTSANNQGGQFLFTSFSGNISAASAGDVMVENDKGGLIFNTGNSKSGSKMRFVVGNWASTPQITVTADNVGIKNLNPNSSYALDVSGDINSSTDVKVNGVSLKLPNQSGHSGDFLSTNGTTASWETISIESNVKYENGAGGSARLIDTDTHEEIQISQLGDMPQTLQDIRDSIPDVSNFVTLNTTQTIEAAKAIFGTDVAFGSDASQKNLLAVISDNNSTAGTWVGRLTVGAKNKTFIMGTYGTICVLGAHAWTNAQQGTGAAWEDVYINPDGNKAVYIGGSPINGKQCLLKIQNVNANTTGTVQINRSTNLTNNFKDVACWGDNVSKFNNDAGYITGIDSNDVINALGYTPQETLVSGTNIKTVNNNSLLGSGNITIDSLPAQSGQNGKFLTTNGTAASWANIPEELPAQSGQNGKFLTTNGSTVSWASITEVEAFTAQEVQTIWNSVMTA